MNYVEKFNQVAERYHMPIGTEVTVKWSDYPVMMQEKLPDDFIHLELIDEYVEVKDKSNIDLRWMVINGWANA
jgi:hypothetical protein